MLDSRCDTGRAMGLGRDCVDNLGWIGVLPGLCGWKPSLLEVLIRFMSIASCAL